MSAKTHATITFTVTSDGSMKRRQDQLPWMIHPPSLSVTMPASASMQATARLLRRLADEIEDAL
jgi:hypothetical protein